MTVLYVFQLYANPTESETERKNPNLWRKVLKIIIVISIIPNCLSLSRDLDRDLVSLGWLISLCSTLLVASKGFRIDFDYGVFDSIVSLAYETESSSSFFFFCYLSANSSWTYLC